MPNWCNNSVTVTHDDVAMLERARDAFRRGQLLQEFIPCPEELRNTEAVYYPEGHELKAEQDRKEFRNIEIHGFKNWYDWQVAHWGTKWDIGDEDGATLDDGVLYLGFDSAWSPPLEAYERLIELGFGIEAFYYEPGMAFCGKWFNGVDECIDIPSTSEEATKVIPEEIDGIFDIVNNMAMWEEDEEEEG